MNEINYDNSLRRLEQDWYSPTRLLSNPVDYDFPGDRFIPNRSLMDLDQAHTLLTNRTNNILGKPKFNDEYRRKMEENLKLDVEGRPFRMLVFRGSPKSSRQSTRLIDEMRRSDEEIPLQTHDHRRHQKFRLKETRILDAPLLSDDYYSNVMDWGKSNLLAVVLGRKLYIWNDEVKNAQILMEVMREHDYPTSVAWSDDAKIVAVGCISSKLQLWDAETSKLVRDLQGHKSRVGCVAWNGHILTSGSKDKAIVNHDVRARNSVVSLTRVHRGEVCGVKWSSTGNVLASGGNDNLVYIWDFRKMSSRHHMHKFNEHNAAVKAIAWCPYKSDVLASGGGINDGCLKIWNTKKGTCISTTETGSQICGIQWNRHHKEILSGHGFGTTERGCKLCLWSYPSMARIGEPLHHANSSRVLHLTQSPDGLTVVSGGADETIRFWEIFAPSQNDSGNNTDLDNLLSLKASAVR
ncbi:cell division cycle 20.5, cofactor of APC complex-like isoform X1 [Nicotiana sylvestris]|uniref:Cell division cycle 20.5, cofactor of APC complex-like isoform X1 n=2 Tax=Nicotiana sylvestris TaxID=4096 RepID=A0A1U7USX9_NICSY|nr:PREDICTED: cell division cycle 20.5, cofactor of APC complex-like isoform X1 [Nicotiana sylvestris]